jgi:hypothetical protein
MEGSAAPTVENNGQPRSLARFWSDGHASLQLTVIELRGRESIQIFHGKFAETGC